MSQYHGDEAIIDVERRKDSSEYNLGDPTLFPPEFLAWLKRFIEQSGIQLPASSIFGTLVPSIGSFRGMPAGMVTPYAGATAPPGTLACDGSSQLRAAFPKLFEVIGVLYGAVDATHFTLPDYRDRTLYGIGGVLAAVTANDGRALALRGPSHHHHFNKSIGVSGSTDGVGDHGHTYRRHTEVGINVQQGTAGTTITVGNLGGFDDGTSGAGGHSHGFSGSGTVDGDTTGGGGQDTTGYHGVLYLITTG